MQLFFKDFSRATLGFQRPPTRNIISQTVHKCTFLVYSNKTLRLELFTSPASLHFSVHLSLKLIVNYCIKHWSLCVNNLSIFWSMIYILSWTTKKHQNTLFRPLHLKLKKIQGLFKDLHRNLRIFKGKMEFKDLSPKIQGLFKTVWTLFHLFN